MDIVKKIKKAMQKNIITIWFIASFLLFGGIVAFTAYTNTNTVQKTVTVHENVESIFTSNYLDKIKDENGRKKIYTKKNFAVGVDENFNYSGAAEFDVVVRNYNIIDITSYCEKKIEYDIIATLVDEYNHQIEVNADGYVLKKDEDGNIMIIPEVERGNYKIIKTVEDTENENVKYMILNNGNDIIVDKDYKILMYGHDENDDIVPVTISDKEFSFSFNRSENDDEDDRFEPAVSNNINLVTATDYTVKYHNVFDQKFPYEKSYKVKIDYSQLKDPNIYMLVRTELAPSPPPNVADIGARLGLSYAIDETNALWKGEFIDEVDESQEDNVKASQTLDGFNYVISGSGTGTGIIVWNADYLELDKYIRDGVTETGIVNADFSAIRTTYDKDISNMKIEEDSHIKSFTFADLGKPDSNEYIQTLYHLCFHRVKGTDKDELWEEKEKLFIGNVPVLQFLFSPGETNNQTS